MNAKAFTLLAAFERVPDNGIVVEIGCVRAAGEVASDGYSTAYLARAAQEHGWTLHSVDIDPQAVEMARHATRDLPVEVHHADGCQWLTEFDGPIDGLYLDGAADPGEAVVQYEAANLAPDAVIVIDDIQPIGDQQRGKGDLLLDRLVADGWTVEVKDTEPGYLMAVAIR